MRLEDVWVKWWWWNVGSAVEGDRVVGWVMSTAYGLLQNRFAGEHDGTRARFSLRIMPGLLSVFLGLLLYLRSDTHI